MDFTDVRDALLKREYDVTVFPDAKTAADYLDSQIHDTSVSLGGSLTLSQMGLPERLAARNTIYVPSPMYEGLTCVVDPVEAASADVFVTSVNALARTGEMISIDGLGNRVSSMLYGHRKVYFVIGRNKLAPTYEDAVWRARNIAAPKNAARLCRDTPCAVSGHCHDCRSPERICRGVAILWEKILRMEMEIVLIDEELGL